MFCVSLVLHDSKFTSINVVYSSYNSQRDYNIIYHEPCTVSEALLVVPCIVSSFVLSFHSRYKHCKPAKHIPQQVGLWIKMAP